MKLAALALSIAALSAHATESIFVQPMHTPVPVPAGYAAQVYTMPDGLSVDVSVPCSLPGPPVIITVGHPSADTVARFPALVAAVKSCPHIIGVYLIDEYGWSRSGYAPGQYATEICTAAHLAHDAGLLVTFLVLGQAVLRDDFIMPPCMDVVDGVAFDYYPSITAPGQASADQIVSEVARIISKLQALGARKVVYVYQAFKLQGESHADLFTRLALQRFAVGAAGALGAAYVAPWGLNLSVQQMAAEPIVQLAGTDLEVLVKP